MNDRLFSVRRAVPADARGMVLLLQEIAAERTFTAITEPWSEAQQEHHLSGLSPRELIQVAEDQDRNVIGYQVLELWAPSLASMAHVGQIGTFVGANWRGCGVGRRLFDSTHDFAAAHGYGKFVIQVRSGNTAALSFYKQLGFEECGRLKRQVRVDGVEDDEFLMELFL
ncbi:MAG TPA: GNAT family N-acetyltransferase [Bryobacteraceae bacterium]|nr:GNAT family N-acetyltransferase [Bryobacteraceae bacterium]